MKKVSDSHILGIDILRFAAAVLAVLFHFGYLMGANPGGSAGSASGRLLAFPELYSWSNFGWVGVMIFFVISGFVIAFSGERATAFSFAVSRLVRLGPGVWICSTITLVTVWILAISPNPQLMQGFRHSMFFLPSEPWIDGAFWTLNIEISFYLCVLVVIALKRFDKIRALAIAIGVCSSAFILFRGAAEYGVLGPSALSFLGRHYRAVDLLLLRHGVYFSIGVLLWAHLIKKPSKSNLFWIFLFGLFACAEIALQSTNVSPYITCGIWLGSLFAIVQSVRYNNLIHRAPQAVLRAMKTAGLMTFPLYLVHTVVGATIMGRFVMLGLSRWAALAAGLTVIFLIAFLIAKYLEPAIQRALRVAIYRLRDYWTTARPAASKVI